MNSKKFFFLALFICLFFIPGISLAQKENLRFEISFPESLHKEPITGRVFVMVSRTDEPEPRLQVGSWSNEVPFFGTDVDQLGPGEAAVIDGNTLGFPLDSLADIPAGEYYVQGLVNIYTRFHRSDGHVIWAHMDQWEGQQFNRSPDNLYSEIRKIRLDAKEGYTIQLSLDQKIPPAEVPPDTKWVKRVKLQSKLEKNFRLIPKGYARVLTGGSTGGWESLALQVFHPEDFGGAWIFYPDPVDFRRYCLSNIYEDENAFYVPGHEWVKVERYFRRDPSGQPLITFKQLSQLEAVLGSKGRSGQQLEIWEATYGPIAEDGYPKPLWDKLTGEIDHDVANYMKEHGYDLRYYLEKNWPEVGPKLVGKLHVICGDMDHYYLNEAVYMLEEFLEGTKDPYYAGSFTYGRPRKGHGWHHVNNVGLVKLMAEHITKNAPAGEDTGAWKY